MNTGRHYELTNETIEFDGHTLHRIRCTEDFRSTTKGTLGGFVEDYENLCGDAWVGGNAKVYDGASVSGIALVEDNACISHGAIITDVASVSDSAIVKGDVWIGGFAKIRDSAVIKYSISNDGYLLFLSGRIVICGNAVIESDYDYIVFKNWWSSGRYFTWTRGNNMWSVGCFYGTGNELIAKAYKDSKVSGREYERVVKYVEQIMRETASPLCGSE